MSADEIELVGGPHDGRRLRFGPPCSDVLELPAPPAPATFLDPDDGLAISDPAVERWQWDGTRNREGVRRFRRVGR